MPPAPTVGEPLRDPCVWMSAGLIRYKLCDRGFDCEHCPLDAALCGRRGVGEGSGPGFGAGGPVWFPADRLYTAGHLWLGDGGGAGNGNGERDGGGESDGDGSGAGGRRLRVGLDAFAAALLGTVAGVEGTAAPGVPVAAGAPLCEVELRAGRLPVGVPLAARPERWNRPLADDPSLLRQEPYEGGWLAELTADPGTPFRRGGSDGLLTADEARRRAGCDLRHFRRRLALLLLADGDGLGPTLPDGGELAVDVPGLLGPRRHLELLRELIH